MLQKDLSAQKIQLIFKDCFAYGLNSFMTIFSTAGKELRC